MPTPELQRNYEELASIRKGFDDMLREQGYFPGAAHPGDVFIIREVLNLDPADLVVGSISRSKYEVFIRDANGQRRMNKQKTDIIRVTRFWTQQQRQLVRKWWDLFSPEARGIPTHWYN